MKLNSYGEGGGRDSSSSANKNKKVPQPDRVPGVPNHDELDLSFDIPE